MTAPVSAVLSVTDLISTGTSVRPIHCPTDNTAQIQQKMWAFLRSHPTCPRLTAMCAPLVLAGRLSLRNSPSLDGSQWFLHSMTFVFVTAIMASLTGPSKPANCARGRCTTESLSGTWIFTTASAGFSTRTTRAVVSGLLLIFTALTMV